MKRETDQVGVRELEAGAGGALVENDFDPGGLTAVRDLWTGALALGHV